MIKDEIKKLKENAKMLEDKYNKLVNSIKEAFYEREDYWDENSKVKPKTESAIMSAAYCLAMMNAPKSKYSFDRGFNIHRGEVFRSEPKILLDFFYIYDKTFENRFGTTPSVLLVRKKNIKVLTETCLKAWKHAVNKSFSDSTILGFKEWLDATSCDEIVSILHEVLEDRIDEVNDKKLYIKDVIIIYPSNPIKNYHF
jgi:hypothetical protein